MKHCRLVSQRATISALTLIAAGLLAPSVFAQGQDGQGAPPPGGGGGGGQRQGGGRRGQGRGVRLTVADIPVSALDAELKLTPEQKSKIATIQKPYMAMRKATLAMMRPPGAQGAAAGGPPPDFSAMRENMQKMRDAGTQAETDINAVLTDSQKAAVPDMIKELGGLQPGVPLDLYAGLALTPDEKTQLADVNQKMGRRWRTESQDAQGDPAAMADALAKWQKDTKREVEAVLTDSQKATYEQYLKDHPDAIRPPFGGGGGFGGGGRRGGGGPGGPGGPPPPGA